MCSFWAFSISYCFRPDCGPLKVHCFLAQKIKYLDMDLWFQGTEYIYINSFSIFITANSYLGFWTLGSLGPIVNKIKLDCFLYNKKVNDLML